MVVVAPVAASIRYSQNNSFANVNVSRSNENRRRRSFGEIMLARKSSNPLRRCKCFTTGGAQSPDNTPMNLP